MHCIRWSGAGVGGRGGDQSLTLMLPNQKSFSSSRAFVAVCCVVAGTPSVCASDFLEEGERMIDTSLVSAAEGEVLVVLLLVLLLLLMMMWR